ncbi:hypothetical protein BDV38DRAFT_56887 [Aspergillus pseudotamarii]|uniref:Uncharacterized protein n=1 Tax=Aspergillus pseudotamarii TaxID=132259 RepID=A0A5N6SYT7_ASPPS|nr:uncharacterized protein BDV38DRAFT_56887 [Aspergillus pseudotamarii]KAE8138939.1 hypothetical protein BDV38DRAFT_56887 [Aspergillus pseudotamarii]
MLVCPKKIWARCSQEGNWHSQSGDYLSYPSFEGSSFHRNKALAAGLMFPSVHHAFHVVENMIEFHVDRVLVSLTAAETLYVPIGKRCQIRFVSRYAKTYVVASGGGLVELSIKEGNPYSSLIIPETEALVDLGHIQQVN